MFLHLVYALMEYFLEGIGTLRGHLQTMWIIFWVFLTPPSPHVDYRGFFANPPYKPCGFFPTPPFRFKNFKEYIIS